MTPMSENKNRNELHDIKARLKQLTKEREADAIAWGQCCELLGITITVNTHDSVKNEIRRLQSELAELKETLRQVVQAHGTRGIELEAQRKEIEELYKTNADLNKMAGDQVYEIAELRKEIEELRKQGKWITTSDKLPEVGDFTAIRIIRPSGQDEYMVREFLANVGWWFDKSVSVAEWTLLPPKFQPPKQ